MSSKMRLINSDKSNNSIFKVLEKSFRFCCILTRIQSGINNAESDDGSIKCSSIIQAACWYLYYLTSEDTRTEFMKKFSECGSPYEMCQVLLDMFSEEIIVNACVQAMADRALQYPAYRNQLLDREDPNQTKRQKPMCNESLKTAQCVLDSDHPIFGHGLKVDPRKVDQSEWKGKNLGGKIIEMARKYVLENEKEFDATGEMPEMCIHFEDDDTASLVAGIENISI